MAEEMTPEERAATLLSVAEECVGEDELLPLLRGKAHPICFDSFEPCGRVHIAQAVGEVIRVNKMVRAGCRAKILVEDQNTGGDLSKIGTAGRYMIEIWRALGMNLGGVEFLWASEEVNKRAHEYWPLVMNIARNYHVGTLASLQENPENLSAAQLLHPIMQCADILFMEVSISIVKLHHEKPPIRFGIMILPSADYGRHMPEMSMDQREVNIMARQSCETIERENRPIILLHHVLPGFKEGQQKISKIDPLSTIFMEDNEAEVKSKIKKAFCPTTIIEGNPCLEYIEHIVLPWFKRFEVVRTEARGGNRTYLGMEELLADYGSGSLHPGDLKPALTTAINQILQPVRDHFEKNSEAKVLRDTVKKYLAQKKIS